MPLTDANRKLLWGRSGGWCAVCRCALIRETSRGLLLVIGEEAHIVSPRVGGPRYRPLEPIDLDHYRNFILLCPNDHALIDKRVEDYSEIKLLEMREAHEEWAAQRRAEDRPIRLRDAKPGVPMPLHLAGNGADLMRIVGNSHAYQYDKPDDLSETEAELLGSFLQEMVDWMDIWSDIGPAGHLRAEVASGRSLEEIDRAGFVVYVGVRHLILEGGIGGPSHWQNAVLLVERKSGQGGTQPPSRIGVMMP